MTQVDRPAGFRTGIPIVSAIVVGCQEDPHTTQVDGPAGFRAGILTVSAIVVGCEEDPPTRHKLMGLQAFVLEFM